MFISTALMALFAYLAWQTARQQKKSQESLLKEQKDIAQKQYDFNIFQMRMKLRNDLENAFLLSLSTTGQDIADDVNIKLASIARILNDIKFAFDANKDLEGLIKKFQSCCDGITRIAMDKRIIIECSEKKKCANGHVLEYKDCLRVYSEKDKPLEPRIMNKALFDNLSISQKEKDIILGIMSMYINCGDTKYDIENYLIALFREQMKTGNIYLNKIFDILDKDITLY